MSDSFCMAQADLNQTAASAEVLSFMTAAASINPRDTEGSLRAISASAIGAVTQVRVWQETFKCLIPHHRFLWSMLLEGVTRLVSSRDTEVPFAPPAQPTLKQRLGCALETPSCIHGNLPIRASQSCHAMTEVSPVACRRLTMLTRTGS